MLSARRHSQSGLSLIEMMIAMVVGLILIAGVLSIYITSRQGYGTNSGIGQIQENGRFAMGFISNAVRQAGYMGCNVSSKVINDLNTVSGNLPYEFELGVGGFDYAGTGPGGSYTETSDTPSPATGAASWSPALDASLPVSSAGYAVPGSDVLVARYVNNDPAYISSVTGANSFDTQGGSTLAAGNIVLVTNCLSGVVMQLTAASAAASSNSVTAAVGGSVVPGNAQAANLVSSFVGAQVVTPTTVAFYVGQGMNKGPALFEAAMDCQGAGGCTFVQNELVPGVENMQVLYGIDTTGTRTPSQYLTAQQLDALITSNPTTYSWNQVVSVRVALLMRSGPGAVNLPPASATPSFNLLGTTINVPRDTRLRRVFTSDIYIRNEQPPSGT